MKVQKTFKIPKSHQLEISIIQLSIIWIFPVWSSLNVTSVYLHVCFSIFMSLLFSMDIAIYLTFNFVSRKKFDSLFTLRVRLGMHKKGWQFNKKICPINLRYVQLANPYFFVTEVLYFILAHKKFLLKCLHIKRIL